MGLFSALFSKGDDGIREWTRYVCHRNIKRSEQQTGFERRLAAVAATIKARNAMNGVSTFTMSNCILEAVPFATLDDDMAVDLLAEYLVRRATGGSKRQAWLEHEINAGLAKFLSESNPLFEHLRQDFVCNYNETGEIWSAWLTAQNHQHLHRLRQGC